jgi:hypothetical protein
MSIKPGTHFSTSEQSAKGAESIPSFLMGENQEFGRQYFKLLNVAFFETYLRDRYEFLPYLSSTYAQTLSRGNPMSLETIQSLTSEELEIAYGRKSPLPIVPTPVELAITSREESILNEIRRTGVLKVAMRRDAPPFGYIDNQQQWSGYCVDLAAALQNYLTKKLALDVGVQVAQLPSTADNSFFFAPKRHGSSRMRSEYHPPRA